MIIKPSNPESSTPLLKDFHIGPDYEFVSVSLLACCLCWRRHVLARLKRRNPFFVAAARGDIRNGTLTDTPR